MTSSSTSPACHAPRVRRGPGPGLACTAVVAWVVGGGLGLDRGARAEAPASFEALLSGAEPAGRLAQFVDPLFAECEQGSSLAARQCALIRGYHLDRMKGRVFSAVGDDAALGWVPFDATSKAIGLEVQGCLACLKPLESLDAGGKSRFFTTKAPRAIKGGRAVGLDVATHELAQPNEKAAIELKRRLGSRLKVQFLFKLAQAPVWKSGPFEGAAFVPVAHRIFDRCTGDIYASSPPSAPGAKVKLDRDATCPEEPTEEELKAQAEAELPEQLVPKQINEVLLPVKDRVHDCGTEFEATGSVNVKLVVSREGKIESISITGPLDKEPAGYCVKSALRGARFPRFRGDKMIITYPFQLQ